MKWKYCVRCRRFIAGIGFIIILGSLVKLHADMGYNLLTDFLAEIGNRKNYSGPEFSIGLGFMF